MSNIIAPRRRPLWRLFIAPVLLLIAAIAWSGFWFFAASQVDVQADAWRAREAKSGRVYDCAKRSVAGFPFRLEVRCDGASVSLMSQTAQQAATRAPVTAKLGEILVVAQVYDPKLLIAEFTAPATISDSGAQSLAVNWRLGRSSIVGLPGVPQRASIEFDDPAIDRVDGTTRGLLAKASHVELHGRLVDGSTPDRPGDRKRVANQPRQHLRPASLAGRAVRCRHPGRAQRIEGFLAQAMAGAVSRAAGRRRPCRDRAVADCAGRSRRPGHRYARPEPRTAASKASCR